jgi:membrane-associated phospholipid phosphatase
VVRRVDPSLGLRLSHHSAGTSRPEHELALTLLLSPARVSESVAIAYFGYLAVVALARPPWPRRRKAIAVSLAAAVIVSVPRLWPETPLTLVARDWLPGLYLVIGYWLSGWYFVAPMKGIEAHFMAVDWRVLGRDTGSALVESLPRAALELLELVYVTCFLFVPGGLVVLVLAGHREAADRFWTLVLVGEFGSFAMLPWIQTRPPRTVEPPGAIDRRPLFMRRMNRLQVNTVSIGVNTFPSGHVAGALATAFAVSEVLPAFAPWLLAMVVAIAIAAVLGRYHYFVDAVAGAVWTLIAWALVRVLW